MTNFVLINYSQSSWDVQVVTRGSLAVYTSMALTTAACVESIFGESKTVRFSSDLVLTKISEQFPHSGCTIYTNSLFTYISISRI